MPLSFAICCPIPFNVYFSHALDFFSILNFEVYGIEVPFNVTLSGGPLISTLSISNVPQSSVTSFPVSFQFFCTKTAFIIFAFATFCVFFTVSVTVLLVSPPVVILNTCPG